jgi:tetratricopeptide (TPR) repeat protein
MTTLKERFDQGRALHQQGKLADAERIYEKVLRQRPGHFEALYQLGLIALHTRRIERSVDLITKAIRLNGMTADFHCNLGTGLAVLNRHEEAAESFNKAIALRPDHVEAYCNLGNALRELKRPEEAIAHYDKAIALRPGIAAAHHNRGIALRDMNRPEEAIASYDLAIALKPAFAEAYYDQALCLLQTGQYELGWRLFEWRKKKLKPVAARRFVQPQWLGGQDVAGKTLFLHSEQGFGDTIQFCRYAKLAEARGANVIMEVHPRLHKLLEQISPTIQITIPENQPAAFDYHCPLMSLPLAFRTTLATVPSEPRYLAADTAWRASWSDRLKSRTKPRIGVVWSGSSAYAADHSRSIDLAAMFSLLELDAEIVCLQKEVSQAEAAMLRRADIAFHGDEQHDFRDAAALIDLMDLVISVDTAVGHLAAAMGKPTWILLSYSPDWRWLLDRDDSPWYPGVRLFRQQRIGDWAGVIDRVKIELIALSEAS